MTKSPDAANEGERSAHLARIVATEFRRRLLAEQLPRIRQCIERLDGGQLWRRPSPNCNSVGNLVLHLCGNTTQWILATFGAVIDERDRNAEFAADGGIDGQGLIAMLTRTYERACATVDAAPTDDLLRLRRVQGRYQETGLSAILHVLEHSSGHAGQIYAWTKQVTGEDLHFYNL